MFTASQLEEQLSPIIGQANYYEDSLLRKRLLYYSNLPLGAMDNFEIKQSPDGKNFDIVSDGKRTTARVAATIGIGETSIFFICKEAEPEKWFYQSKKKDEIKSLSDLRSVVLGFILLEPGESVMIDVRRSTLEEKMNKSTRESPVQLTSMKDFRRGPRK